LLDVLGALHEALLSVAIELAEKIDLSKLGPELDELAAAISTVEVIGPIERSMENSFTDNRQSQGEIGVDVRQDGLKLSAKVTDNAGTTSTNREVVKQSGSEIIYVKFGTVQSRFRVVLDGIGARRL
jgi:hypothetical protein